MYDENREIVSKWGFSDFYNDVDFITKGNNFSYLVIGMATEAESNMDRFMATEVRFLFLNL